MNRPETRWLLALLACSTIGVGIIAALRDPTDKTPASADDVMQWPLLACMGLLAAWVIRRGHGLIAPIAFHAFNNAAACLAIISTTARLDRVMP